MSEIVQSLSKVQGEELFLLHSELARLYNVGRTYLDQGMYGPARLIFRQVVVSVEQNSLYSSRDAIFAFISLATVYHIQGEYHAADIILERGIHFALKAIRRKNAETSVIMRAYLQCTHTQYRV
ncbi:MAG TPA: hypothetical protein VFV38_18000 [Ktedonobacteraceae bacterium]|nr:hypothetical protein [Ktedonobacteraceae bacterium]